MRSAAVPTSVPCSPSHSASSSRLMGCLPLSSARTTSSSSRSYTSRPPLRPPAAPLAPEPPADKSEGPARPDPEGPAAPLLGPAPGRAPPTAAAAAAVLGATAASFEAPDAAGGGLGGSARGCGGAMGLGPEPLALLLLGPWPAAPPAGGCCAPPVRFPCCCALAAWSICGIQGIRRGSQHHTRSTSRQPASTVQPSPRPPTPRMPLAKKIFTKSLLSYSRPPTANLLFELGHQQLLRGTADHPLLHLPPPPSGDGGVALEGGRGAVEHKDRTDTVEQQPVGGRSSNFTRLSSARSPLCVRGTAGFWKACWSLQQHPGGGGRSPTCIFS